MGGSSVLIRAADGAVLALDLGLPLEVGHEEQVGLPQEVANSLESLAGVVVTHGHPDHYGLLDELPEGIPVLIGRAVEAVLAESAFFGGASWRGRASMYLEDRAPLELGPFRITPFLVDHSAFDSYALLVEVDGRRLFYSGDLRGHGRKRRTFDRLLREPPPNVDTLLLEGTRIGREEAGGPASEQEVEELVRAEIRGAANLVLAFYSPQNVDRLVSFYKAARREGRELVLDLYGAIVAAATMAGSIPRAGWQGIRVFVPRSQRSRVIASGEFGRIDAVSCCRVFAEELAAEPDRFVLSFRASMLRDLPEDAYSGAGAIWSMWPGYLRRPSATRLLDDLNRLGVPLSVVHCSGHATVADLGRLAKAIAPARVVPIHTGRPDHYPNLFDHVEPHRDGEWWGI